MNSVAESLSWEFLSRSRWSILASSLGTAIIPVITLLLMQNAEALDRKGRDLETLHFVWIHCECLALIAASVFAHTRVSRLYTLPISTKALALWRLIPGSVANAVAFLLTAVAINLLFEIEWPVWGPALFVGVATATVQAAIWLGGRSPLLQIVVVTLASAPLSFWLKAHYGPIVGQPNVYWHTVTPLDGACLAACAILSYYLAVAALTRDRRGDAPNFARWRAWFEEWQSRRRTAIAIPSSPLRAQFWYEWTQKGLFLPVTVTLFTLVFVSVWVWGGSKPDMLREGMDGIGFGLCVIGVVVGLAFGHCGRADGNPQFGGFLASRPLTDTSIALSILRTTGRSVVTAWLFWALTRAVLVRCLAPDTFHTPTEEFWLHAGILLGAWTAAALPACAALTGRAEFCVGMIIGVCLLLVCEALLVRLFVPSDYRMMADRALAYLDAFAGIALAVWMFAKALRRGLLPPFPVFLAAVIWASLVAVGGSALITNFVELRNSQSLFLVVFACGTALSLAPIAAAPLAVSWNRHR